MINRQDIEKQEEDRLASYAVKSGASYGRQFSEDEHPYRTRFQRDRDRVIHSSAFRRLEYKTQVFVYNEGDYYRTRLTHSLEVAQIARSICKSMELNEDLAETIALAHDLGHPPFGHNAQDILNRLMQDHGGFEHNRQSLRIVKVLEKRYPEFAGLNLTWEALEGISKHSRDKDNPIHQRENYQSPSLEMQVTDCADRIAYNAHDLDDGITSAILDLSQLREVALWNENEKWLDEKYTNLDFKLKKYQIVRRIINDLIGDLRTTTLDRVRKLDLKTVDDIRKSKERPASFSPEMDEKNTQLTKFLRKNMYQHPRVKRMEFKADLFLTKIFAAYTECQHLLPEAATANQKQESLEIRICDHISGMTDRYAIGEYKKLFETEEG